MYANPKYNAKWHLLMLLAFALLSGFPLKAQNQRRIDFEIEPAAHPRLLLDAEGMLQLTKTLHDNGTFAAVHAYILAVSDSIVDLPPLEYRKEGKRILAISRNALARIYYLSYSYRFTKSEKYLQRAERELLQVCSYPTWNPTHFLDVGEMAMAVAIGYDWLFSDLKSTTKEQVVEALKQKAIAPYDNSSYNWFLSSSGNWNSVCNAGLVFAALAIFEEEKELATAVINSALETIHLPLAVYEPSGNYPEGPGYWDYGTSFQVMMIAALESALANDFGLLENKGFMKSADYMLFAAGSSGEVFNYSDCHSAQGANPTMFWFADKLNQPSLLYEEQCLMQEGVYTGKRIDRLLPNALVFGRNISMTEIKAPASLRYVGYGHTPVAFYRTNWDDETAHYFGIKGGSASEPHAHMDQGTFVYDIGKLRWAMDFGMQDYGSIEREGVDLWNLGQESDRWEVFRYNNLNHNTLSINNQLHNATEKTEIVDKSLTNKFCVELDLTAVLNRDGELERAIRTVSLSPDDCLTIEDELKANDLPVNLRWNMLTPASVELINDCTFKLTQQGEILYLLIESNQSFISVIRPAVEPSQYNFEFKEGNYAAYNASNPGVVMLGFDATIDAGMLAKFSVKFLEELP
ncbi:MAG: heparinase II/III family protein [Mangrovibacterium sp.]